MNGSSGDKYVDICSEIPLVSDVSAIASTLVVADIIDFTVCHTACTPWSSDIVTCTVAVIKKKVQNPVNPVPNPSPGVPLILHIFYFSLTNPSEVLELLHCSRVFIKHKYS